MTRETGPVPADSSGAGPIETERIETEIDGEREVLERMRAALPDVEQRARERRAEADALGEIPLDADPNIALGRAHVRIRAIDALRELESLQHSIAALEAGIRCWEERRRVTRGNRLPASGNRAPAAKAD
jgi:hypothetical protein